MSHTYTLLLLLMAAILEAGGDALVRWALKTSALPARTAFFALGGIVLFLYGYVVNTPPWDFGRSLGVYVACFFVVAQLIAWLVFKQPPSPGVLVGGAFVVMGGTIMTAWSS